MKICNEKDMIGGCWPRVFVPSEFPSLASVELSRADRVTQDQVFTGVKSSPVQLHRRQNFFWPRALTEMTRTNSKITLSLVLAFVL